MRKHQIWYGLILVFAVVMHIMANSAASLAMLVLLICGPVLCCITQLLAMRNVHLECRTRNSCYAGQELPLELVLTKKNRIPLGMIRVGIEIENVLYRETDVRVVTFQPTAKRQQTYQYPIVLNDCGERNIRITKIEYFDMGKVFRWKKSSADQQRVMSYPPQLRMSLQMTRRPETETSGEMYDPFRKGQDNSEVSGLRSYIEGDSMGSIHWKLSSKVDELIIREFGYPSNYSTVILCDMAKMADGNKIANACNNAVLAMTAQVSYSLLELNRAHNVVRIVNQEYQSMPVDSTKSHEEMTMNYLCAPVTEEKNSGDAIYYFLRSNLVNEFTKMIYITSTYDEGAVRELARHMDITVIHAVMGQQISYADVQGYSIIAVEAESYADRTYNIVI